MSQKVIILNVTKPDFREIKSYVKQFFGDNVLNEVNQEFKGTVSNIGINSEAGKEIEELKEIGLNNFRTRLVRQTRIVYEFNDKEVLVHMFIYTKRDFRTQLMKRILSM
ncbi:hypothetical protein BRCH_01176 [Candidatus Burkholderia brachyanthoides]|nr:hypothetical protein BRCH_01176 [Candidatus Burkholderia brachyanthoides]